MIPGDVSVVELAHLWESVADEVMTVENASYETARQGSREFFDGIVEHPRSICLALQRSDEIVGFCLGGTLEFFADEHGVPTDLEFDAHSTFYSADCTIAERFRGRGYGRLLKTRQLSAARAAGFTFVAARIRVGVANTMLTLVRSLGSVEIQYFDNYYHDDIAEGDLLYYRIDLHDWHRQQQKQEE